MFLRVVPLVAFFAACTSSNEQLIASPDAGVVALSAGPADVLFVVDNSSAMDVVQERLAAAFPAFLDAFASDVDLQVAIVSTDQSSRPFETGGSMIYTYSPALPHVLVEIDNLDCEILDITHGCFRGPNPELRVLRSRAMKRSAMVEAFAKNVRLGTCGAGDEMGLLSANVALEHSVAGRCNEGFLREEASLVVVYVSNEDDSDVLPLEQYATELTRFKKAELLRVAMMVGAVDGQAANCRSPEGASCGSVCAHPPPEGSHMPCTMTPECPSNEFCDRDMHVCRNVDLELFSYCASCSVFNAPDCCQSLAGPRYVDFAKRIEALGGRSLIESICTDDFTPAMLHIAESLIAR